MAAKRISRDPEFEYFSFNETSASGSVPAFLSKLWILVEDPSNNDIICWDTQGTSFHIYDQSRFASEVLPYYFKHNNISSFIRQLNMYGFRKVPNMEHGGLKVERDDLQFQHPCFVQGCEELLDRIKRKTGQTRTEQRPVTVDPDSLSKVLTEVNQIKSKQDSFNTRMEDLKKENQILWREVIKLTKKYQQQQHIISKLMHFLMSLVNTHRRGMPGLSRKRPLMINAPESSASSEASAPKKASIVLNDAGDHDYTVQSPADLATPAVPNTSGVVIQELLDHLEPSLDTSTIQNPMTLSVVSQVPAASLPTAPPPAVTVLTSMPGQEPSVLTTVAPQFLVSQPTVPPTQAVASVSQPQQPQQTSGEAVTSQQIALRGIKDQPLSSSSTLQSPKDISEQMKLLQCDLDSVREVLSSGQFNLDPNFILGLFDPETPLPVSIDSSLMDLLPTEGSSTDIQASSAPAQLPASSSDTISGNELSQYQPADPMFLPSLFDELEQATPAQEDSAPVFFDNEDSGLNTPAIVESKPLLTDGGDFEIGDLD